MADVHLTKTYCLGLPTLMYEREIWTLTDNSWNTISAAWNNCFRRIFKCCWRYGTSVFLQNNVNCAINWSSKNDLWQKVSQSESSVL